MIDGSLLHAGKKKNTSFLHLTGRIARQSQGFTNDFWKLFLKCQICHKLAFGNRSGINLWNRSGTCWITVQLLVEKIVVLDIAKYRQTAHQLKFSRFKSCSATWACKTLSAFVSTHHGLMGWHESAWEGKRERDGVRCDIDDKPLC